MCLIRCLIAGVCTSEDNEVINVNKAQWTWRSASFLLPVTFRHIITHVTVSLYGFAGLSVDRLLNTKIPEVSGHNYGQCDDDWYTALVFAFGTVKRGLNVPAIDGRTVTFRYSKAGPVLTVRTAIGHPIRADVSTVHINRRGIMIASASNGVKPCVQSQRYESVYVLGVACDSRVSLSRKTPVPQCHVKQYEVVTPTLRGWPVTFSTARKGIGPSAWPLFAVPCTTAYQSTAGVTSAGCTNVGPRSIWIWSRALALKLGTHYPCPRYALNHYQNSISNS